MRLKRVAHCWLRTHASSAIARRTIQIPAAEIRGSENHGSDLREENEAPTPVYGTAMLSIEGC